MRYKKIIKFDTANGPGIRTTLFVSGCSHRCKGCHNPETWDPTTGYRFTKDTTEEILDSLDSDYISGLTLSGGDPLHFMNIRQISHLVSKVRSIYPNKSIWLYTGDTWEYLLKEAYQYRNEYIYTILDNIDVLVDGKFDITKKDISLPYCGSSNQRVIDVKESLKTNKIILYNND